MKFQTDSGCPSTAALLRVLEVCTPGGKLQANQWTRFIGVRGKHEGNSHLLYYVAYLFLEKLRVAQGVPKDKSRLKNEEELEESVARLAQHGIRHEPGFSRDVNAGWTICRK